MSKLVVDANVVIDWFDPSEEGERYSRRLEPMIEAGDLQLVVPLHFDIEVTAHLVKKSRSKPKVFTPQWLNASISVLDALPFEITGLGMNFKLLSDLAKSFNLSVYDTPYFQLARIMGIPIATRDNGLITACNAWNVELWVPSILAE